jgi:tetratricopeptide (TPR) repeat protein
MFSGKVFADAKDWSVYRTDHFIYHSDKSEAEVTRALKELETFRAVLFNVLNLDKNQNIPAVKVYAFKSNKDFNKLVGGNVAGYFQNNLRGPLMAVGNNQANMSVIYHEYIHYLARALRPTNYPHWFNEGIAEFYSTMQIKADHVVVGNLLNRRASKNTASTLIKLETLLSETNFIGDKHKMYVDKFYSNSWLLVHFFLLGNVNGVPDYSTELNQFLDLQNKGTDWQTAFNSSFDIAFEDFEKQFERYNRKRSLYARKLPRPTIDLKFNKTPMDEGEMLATLSHLTFSTGNRKQSDIYLQQALRLESSLALSVSALLAQRDGKTKLAQNLISKALAKKPLSAETLVNIGQTYRELAYKLPKRKKEMRRLAIYYLNRSAKVGFMPIAHTHLAAIYWQLNQKDDAIAEITNLIKNIPSNIHANFQAGDYFARVGKYEEARYFLNNVLAWSHRELYISRAQKILNKIERTD